MGKSIQIRFISNIFAALVLVFWSIDAELKISEGDRRNVSEDDILAAKGDDVPLHFLDPCEDQQTIISDPNKTEELFLMWYTSSNSTKFALKYKELFNEHADREEKAVDDTFIEDKSKKVQVLNDRSRRCIVVKMRNVTFFDSANYTLVGDNGSGKANLTFQLLVKNDPMVTIESNKDNEVNCNVIGYPLPSNVNLQILDDQNKTTSTRYFNMTHITSTINQTSIFLLDQPGDNGQKHVRCVANYIEGVSYYSKIQTIELRNKKPPMSYLLMLTYLLGAMLLLLLIYIWYSSPKKFRIIEVQSRIGYGAYGVVHKAIVMRNGLVGKMQTVAIKTLRPHESMKENKLNFNGIEQLLSELKIMMKLKKHEYIVGFIGAITENVLKGELMLIFEFCDGFNLKDFLQNKIGNGAFVNQVESTHYGYRINKNKTTPSPARTQNDVEINNRHMPDTQINDNSADTILNVAENQTKIYTTTDLLRWSTQIANGSKFLASHNIVHCDLAARNIILCGNDIKICDFGLARVISKNEIYKMTNGIFRHSPRWMAIEVHRNESIFNEKSDVWSFGLVMLEMFSEGQDPFPHISDDDINADTILTEIEAMNDDMSRKPPYTTQKIYNIMLSCWTTEPEERPSFGELERDICDLVNDEEDVEIEDYSEYVDNGRPLTN